MNHQLGALLSPVLHPHSSAVWSISTICEPHHGHTFWELGGDEAEGAEAEPGRGADLQLICERADLEGWLVEGGKVHKTSIYAIETQFCFFSVFCFIAPCV